MTTEEHQPGADAPVIVRYEELSVFGSPTGKAGYVREGERLPHGPLGYSSRQIKEKI
jgi:hypothetical protein